MVAPWFLVALSSTNTAPGLSLAGIFTCTPNSSGLDLHPNHPELLTALSDRKCFSCHSWGSISELTLFNIFINELEVNIKSLQVSFVELLMEKMAKWKIVTETRHRSEDGEEVISFK